MGSALTSSGEHLDNYDFYKHYYKTGTHVSVFIGGIFVDVFKGKIYMYAIGFIIGTAVTYAFGTTWLAYQAHMSFSAALAAGVIPFLPGDAAKIVIALVIAPIIKKQLVKAHLL